MNLLYTYSETIVDGEGIRFSIYLAGCSHRCPGCHNPASWDPKAGTPLTDEVLTGLIRSIRSNPLLDGVTLSGGDPFFCPEELLTLVRRLKQETGLNLWCYTGYTLEQLQARPACAAVLSYVDVLVDGPFVASLYSPYLEFRGSSNQRIVRLSSCMEQAMPNSSPRSSASPRSLPKQE
ncbi:MAG: anaerobic ribonucleoside-triphosphate reductase activating protein [Bacteroidaceae bacterium]